MEKVRICFLKEKNRAEASLAELPFLLAGVLDLVFLMRGVRGLSFSLWTVCSAAALLCGGLWYARRKGPKATAVLLGGLLLLCAAGAFFFREKLAVQLQCLGEVFSSGSVPEPIDDTGAILLLTVGVAVLLFVGEFLLNCHRLFAVLLPLLLLVWVLSGFQFSLWVLVFLALFTGGFWAIQGQRGAYFPKSGVFTASLMAAVLFLSWPIAVRFFEEFSLPAYRAEEMAYRAWRSFSGTDQNLYLDGDVSRGNHYQTGAVQLELSTTPRPSESIYLRGFAGGEYVGGRWFPAEDEALLERVKNTLDWGMWNYMVDGMYRTMYYVVNQCVIRDDPPSPMSLTICYEGDKSPGHFVPYYSRLTSDWLTAEGGYTCELYEPKDMLLDWDRVPEDSTMLRDWNRMVHDAYAQEAAAAYVGVPADRVPRLVRLAEEHPLDDLKEITAFILQTLNENAVYSQTPGWTPANEEVVEDFLFEKHSGYCVHYASTAVLLYRLYGIPARYASGYLVPPEKFFPEADDLWQAAVTDECAHAWAEIFLPDYGWTPVEVTPNSHGEILIQYPGFTWSTANRQPEGAAGSIPILSLRRDTASSTADKQQAGRSSPKKSGEWILWLYLAGYLAILGFLFLDARREEILCRRNAEGCRKAFGHLLDLFCFCGVLMDCDGMEPNFPQRAAQVIPLVSPKEWETVLRYTSEAAYGRAAPDDAGDTFVREIYQKSARFLFPRLPWHKKLLFRFWKVFL